MCRGYNGKSIYGDFGPQQTAPDQNNWSRTKITSDLGPVDQTSRGTISEILVHPDQNSGDNTLDTTSIPVVAAYPVLRKESGYARLLLLTPTCERIQ